MNDMITWGAKAPVSLRQCLRCATTGKVYKSGRVKHGPQRYVCRACGRTFQLESPKVALTEEAIHCIIRLYREGKTYAAITAETGASPDKISKVTREVRGRKTGKSCPACNSYEVSRFGKSRNGRVQRLRCRECHRTFSDTSPAPGRNPVMSEHSFTGDALNSTSKHSAVLTEFNGQRYETLPGSVFETGGSVLVPAAPVEGCHSVHTFDDAKMLMLAVAPDLRTAVGIATLAASHLGGYGSVIVMASSQAPTHYDPQSWLCEE